jgi:hypothetical protein
MNSFVHTEYPAQHPGVIRAERATQAIQKASQRFDGARGAATLLLAAVVAALMVVANQVIETWTEGHLLMAWVILWAITFAAIALLVNPARLAAGSLRTGLQAWKARRRQAAADDKLWAIALTDARVMADISRAMGSQASRKVPHPYY